MIGKELHCDCLDLKERDCEVVVSVHGNHFDTQISILKKKVNIINCLEFLCEKIMYLYLCDFFSFIL